MMSCSIVAQTEIILLVFALSLCGGISFLTQSSGLMACPQPNRRHVQPTTTSWFRRHHRSIGEVSVQKVKERSSKRKNRKAEYEERKQLWLDRYGSLEALQSTFGTGSHDRGGIFSGDLTPEQTRRLYHSLLPRSLLGLYEMKLMKPDELAPLAYSARIAAKQYARSRCVWYARAATALFDQYRNLRDKGQLRLFGSSNMTWQEIWSKYEAQIVQEECARELDSSDGKNQKTKHLKDKDLTMRIYLRILEKSCTTNQIFDRMFLSKDTSAEEEDVLSSMGEQLDRDVRNILLRPNEIKKLEKKAAKWEKRLLKTQLKEKKEEEKAIEKEQEQRRKANKKLDQEKVSKPSAADVASDSSSTNKSQHRFQVLRVLAGTRRKFRQILK